MLESGFDPINEIEWIWGLVNIFSQGKMEAIVAEGCTVVV